MIARRPGRLDRRLAIGAQPGQRGGAEELGARHRQHVCGRLQRGASDDRHRRVAVGGRHVRAGGAQEGGDALHRPTAQRLVPVERDAQRQAGHGAGNEPHGRAGVAAVQVRVSRRPAGDHVAAIVLGDADAQRAEAFHRGEHVAAGGADADRCRTTGQRADDQCAVRDRLVGRHRQPAPQPSRGTDRRRG